MLETGTQVGRYRVLKLIAQGGMAEVYQANQELASGILRPAALKVIRPEYSESEDFREMFLDEARTACTLSHPNIVHIYEVGEADGLIYMGMEFVPGMPLSTVARALSERGERLPNDALLAIGIFTCSALEAVHALKLPGSGHLNLVHRDVSPHNLLLSATGSLKLIDFGIAKAATNRNLTRSGVTKGKAGYFSPEQAMGKLLDGRSDLFSLGVTLYKLASGVTPFEGYNNHRDRNQALVAGRWEPLENIHKGLLPGFYEVVRKALQLRPEERYASAGEMRQDLEAVALEAGIHIGPSVLAGYVEEKDGDVSVARVRVPAVMARPSGPKPRLSPDRVPAATPPATAPAPEPDTATAPAATTSPSAPGLPRLLLAAGVLLLLLIAGVGVLLLRPAPPPPAPVAVTPGPPVKPPPAVAPPPTPAPPPVQPSPPPTVARPTPPAAPAAPTPAPHPRPERHPEPHHRATVALGEGELRINSTPKGDVILNGAQQGGTPLVLKVKAGSYKVRISNPTQNIPGYCKVEVEPDKTVLLRYDFKADHCAVDHLDRM